MISIIENPNAKPDDIGYLLIIETTLILAVIFWWLFFKKHN